MQLLSLLTHLQFCDGAFGTSQGVLRGMGRQGQLMVYNLVGFWGMGVALGWWLTFKVGTRVNARKACGETRHTRAHIPESYMGAAVVRWCDDFRVRGLVDHF